MSVSLQDKVILVVGLARSGCAVGRLLRRHGARVIGVDDAPADQVESQWVADDLSALAREAYDAFYTGGDWSFLANEPVHGVALSPGVPLTHPQITRLSEQGTPVHGELDWAARFFRGTIVAVTGTNGKSTTTELIAHVARTAGWTADAVGNVGRPLSLVADELGRDAVAVVEVSSFQLETIAHFVPRVGIVLNLAPDHLDRYPDLAAYYEAKRRLATALPPGGTFVTWTGCAEARQWPTPAAKILFGDREAGAAVYPQRDHLWVKDAGAPFSLVKIADLPFRTGPQLLNVLAAIAALWPLQPDRERLAEGLRTFRGLPHRQQLVAKLGAVHYVDDSKATNVAAVKAGLTGVTGRVVLIAGGRGKGEDYTPLRKEMRAVQGVVVIGEEGPAIAEALAGTVLVEMAPNMEVAVTRATEWAQPSGTVLLSPACASFDMYRNYHERGEAFTAAALALGAVQGEVS
jgi:UDP-N-acetylmuramoylalanine--D-glutamate ligase